MFEDPEFWVLVAFVLFVGGVAYKAYMAVAKQLDNRSAKIKAELDEAVRLREEAQGLLAGYQRQQRDAVQEAAAIVEHAKTEAEQMAAQAEADLEASLARRADLAVAKIDQAEVQALQDVREVAIEVATEAARRLITENLDEARAGELVDRSIAEAGRKLN